MKIKKYLAEIGRKGGKARKKSTTKEQRQEWGKLGGRPKKQVGDKSLLK